MTKAAAGMRQIDLAAGRGEHCFLLQGFLVCAGSSGDIDEKMPASRYPSRIIRHARSSWRVVGGVNRPGASVFSGRERCRKFPLVPT